jgi:hypothetical protein
MMPLRFDEHSRLPKWPTQTRESDELRQSKYMTPEGLNWLFDYLDSLHDDVSEEERRAAQERTLFMMNMVRGTDFKESDPEYEALLEDENVMSALGSVFGRSFSPYHEQEAELLWWARWRGDKTVLERMVRFARKAGRATYHRDLLAQVGSIIDASYAGELWLKELRESAQRDTSDDKRRYRRDVARILYRLELGRIGISDEGVEYLGKRFDLGDYNSVENFVRRLIFENHFAHAR